MTATGRKRGRQTAGRGRAATAAAAMLVMWLTLSGCATAPKASMRPPGFDYAAAGGAAEVLGDWNGARRSFGQAVLVADQTGWPAQQRARMHYDYGRALGVTCFYSEAERELSLAYDLDILTNQVRYPALIELARLALVQKRYAQSAHYFGQALSSLDRMQVERNAPFAYADMLDDYARALGGDDRPQEANRMIDRAAHVRASVGERTEASTRTPYGTHCPAG